MFLCTIIVKGEIPSAQPSLFEYYFDTKQLKWVPWVDVVPEYIHAPAKKFGEILVPTVDTVRTTWLLQLQVNIRRPVVLVGETGTSKSATTANFLRGLDPESTVSIKNKEVIYIGMLYQNNNNNNSKFLYVSVPLLYD